MCLGHGNESNPSRRSFNILKVEAVLYPQKKNKLWKIGNKMEEEKEEEEEKKKNWGPRKKWERE